ncbi:hypothetical protein L596_027387 [Steinernema carpocapsae]|uniref:C-type lectin domain-containing protein n=1 Tax=Steinernema carpocapsae TaxID=34508 RepID=A0A4V5ZYJ0_STECR|nr:hypothetical protein L596_027387 [Steinernema carpocapsae]
MRMLLYSFRWFFVIKTIHCAYIKYTEISGPFEVTGDIRPSKGSLVANDQECVKLAFESNVTSGYIIKNDYDILTCMLFKYLASYSNKGDLNPKKRFFMADLRQSDQCSTEKTTVQDLLSDMTKCDKMICDDLKELANFSSTQKAVTYKRPFCETGQFGFNRITHRCLYAYPFQQLHVGTNPEDRFKSECTGKSLDTTSISSKDANDELAFTLGVTTQLIGLYIPKKEAWAEDKFEWEDGSKFAYQNWAEGYPKKVITDSKMVFLHGDKVSGVAGQWTNGFNEHVKAALDIGVAGVLCSKTRT